jgi:predicted secreted protein
VGIDGDQANGMALNYGAVYVFSRDSTGGWSGTPTYVKASNTGANDGFGGALALSADGNTLAVGALFEASEAVDIGGDQGNNLAFAAGAVYVFSRDSAGVWGGTPTYVKASNTEGGDNFGGALALSADGNTLAVGATGEDSAGISGNNNETNDSGAVYVYRRNIAGIWSDAFYIKTSTVAANINVSDSFGGALALSADGNTLAVGATGEDSDAVGIGGDQGNSLALNSGAVYVY